VLIGGYDAKDKHCAVIIAGLTRDA